MDSFTRELVSDASAHLFLDNTLSSLKKLFTGATESIKVNGRKMGSGKSYQSKYQNVAEGKFMFFDNKLSNSSELNYLEPGLYPSITDIVEAMNTLIQ